MHAEPRYYKGSTEERAQEFARELVYAGFVTRAEATSRLFEFLVDDEAAELTPAQAKPTAAKVVDEVWRQRLADQASWSSPTDAERLRDAFRELDTLGIICRMNFTDCSDCANDEIGAERMRLADGEPPLHPDYGFRHWASVTFHSQDSARLADEPARLYLGYGCWIPGPALPDRVRDFWGPNRRPEQPEAWDVADTALGELLVSVLHRHGLKTEWNGTNAGKVIVTDLRWRRSLGPDGPLERDPSIGY